MLRRLFLASVFVRLAIALSIGCAVQLAFLGLSLYLAYPNWKALQTDFVKWQASGRAASCESLFDSAKREMEQRPKCDVVEMMSTIGPTKCMVENKQRYATIEKRLTSSGCPMLGGGQYDAVILEMMREKGQSTSALADKEELPVYAPPIEPAPLLQYAQQESPEKMVAQWLAMAAALFACMDLGGSFIVMGHKGWQRLAVAASPLVGVIGAWVGYGSNYYSKGENAVVYGLTTTVGAFALIVYGRRIFVWIKAGFGEHAPAQTTPIAPNQLTQSAEATGPGALPEIPIDETSSLPLATFWPRLWARCIDLSLMWLFANVIFMLVPNIGASMPPLAGVVANVAEWMAAMGIAIVAYDTFWICKTGTTPGKAWLGLAVRTPEGYLPSRAASTSRSWTFFASGLFCMLGFPFLQLISARSAYASMSRIGGQLGWDFASRTFVHQRPVGAFRYNLAATIGALLIGGLVVFSRMGQDDVKNEIFNAATKSPN